MFTCSAFYTCCFLDIRQNETRQKQEGREYIIFTVVFGSKVIYSIYSVRHSNAAVKRTHGRRSYTFRLFQPSSVDLPYALNLLHF